MSRLLGSPGGVTVIWSALKKLLSAALAAAQPRPPRCADPKVCSVTARLRSIWVGQGTFGTRDGGLLTAADEPEDDRVPVAAEGGPRHG